MAFAGNLTAFAQEDENAALPAANPETQSKAYTVETLPITSSFGREKFVCNPDGVLSQAAADSISNIMQLLEEDTKAQVMFVAVNAIEPADEKEFATALGNKLGVGDTTNNGLVVLLVKDLRAIYFAPGMGLENVMNFTYKCSSCGHEEETVEDRYKNFGGGKFNKDAGAGTRS